MAVLRFTVKIDNADADSSTLVVWTAAQIREQLPQFAALFPENCDDAFPSLHFTTDVYQYSIEPLGMEFIAEEKAERAAAESARP